MEDLVVGQRALLERLVIALLAGGHVLIEGVPGPRQDAGRPASLPRAAFDLPFRAASNLPPTCSRLT